MRRRLGSVTLAVAAALRRCSARAGRDSGSTLTRSSPPRRTSEKLAQAGFDVTEGRRAGGNIEVSPRASRSRGWRRSEVRAVMRDRQGPHDVQRSAQGRRGSRRGRARSSRPASDRRGSDAAYDVWTAATTRCPATARSSTPSSTTGSSTQYPGSPSSVGLGADRVGPRRSSRMKITQGRRRRRRTTAPAVLFNAMQHAREWLAGETCRRTLDFTSTTPTATRRRDPRRRSRELVDTRELWFVCIVQPGRLRVHVHRGQPPVAQEHVRQRRRRHLGEANDGIDPNRNYPANWGLDDEGSSTEPSNETYRGTGPDSEPETQAMKSLWDMVDFTFQKNDHTAAELLLYPQGFQQYTPTPDNAIFAALAGNDAARDRRQDVERRGRDLATSRATASTPTSAAELYITNGDTLGRRVPLARDPRLHAGGHRVRPAETSPGFEFEDDEDEDRGRVPAPPAVLARPAQVGGRPGEPGLAPRQRRCRTSTSTRSPYSYGDPQPVEVSAKRVARRRAAALPDQRRQREAGADEGVRPAASASTTIRASSSTACAAR